MGCCCCGQKDSSSSDTEKNAKHRLYKVKTIEPSDREDERKQINVDKLNEANKQSFRGGESAYAKEKRKLKGKNNEKKSIAENQYNKKGLIDERSQEFQAVKDFLKTKDYELMCSIGSGSYAEVYKAWATKYHRAVAVKVISLVKTHDNYRLNHLQHEVQVLQLCKHENIIKVYELNQTKKRIFIIMDFAAKGTLTDWLRDHGAFTESLAKEIFPQILNAIHHMHSQYIAHRDLKLENILLNSKLVPKVSDFSYSVIFKPGSPLCTDHCGSLPYFAPELLQKQPYNPLISDIWSLGVCFYIMLNDRLPFKLGDDRLMLHKELYKDWKFRNKIEPKITEELKTSVRRMLDPDTSTRITSEQLMQLTWFKDHTKHHKNEHHYKK